MGLAERQTEKPAANATTIAQAAANHITLRRRFNRITLDASSSTAASTAARSALAASSYPGRPLPQRLTGTRRHRPGTARTSPGAARIRPASCCGSASSTYSSGTPSNSSCLTVAISRTSQTGPGRATRRGSAFSPSPGWLRASQRPVHRSARRSTRDRLPRAAGPTVRPDMPGPGATSSAATTVSLTRS